MKKSLMIALIAAVVAVRFLFTKEADAGSIAALKDGLTEHGLLWLVFFFGVVTDDTHPDLHKEGFTKFTEIYARKQQNFFKKLIPREEQTSMSIETRGQEGDLPAAPISNPGQRFQAAEFFTGNSYTLRPQLRALKYEVFLLTITAGPAHLAKIMGKVAGKLSRSIYKARELSCATLYAGMFTTTVTPTGEPVADSPGFTTGHPLGDGTFDANRGVDDGLGLGTFADINFSPLGFEKVYDQYGQQNGHEGDPLTPNPGVMVICSHDIRSRVKRFVKNDMLAETANRDINPNYDSIQGMVASPWLNYAGLSKFWGIIASDGDEQPFLRLVRSGDRPRTWIEEDGAIRVYANSAMWVDKAEDYRGSHFTQGS